MTCSACAIARTAILTSDKRLFHCTKSMKFISKHKIDDLWPDFYEGEDESSYFQLTMKTMKQVVRNVHDIGIWRMGKMN
jgi:hypothetical protein